MRITFDLEGLPELAARLDTIARTVVDPIVGEALERGGEVIRARAEQEVHKLTGALAADVVIVTRAHESSGERYVLIGPGWNPESFRRTVQRRGKWAQEAPRADQTTNPGLYGFFLETGHRAPGHGLSHDLEYRRASAAARKSGSSVNSAEFGNISTPPYPWLGPAFDETKDQALEVVADTIRQGLEGLNLQ